MGWNHRIFRSVDHGEEIFTVREVMFNNEGHIWGWTEAIEPLGNTLDELKQELEWMREACDKHVIDEAEALEAAKDSRVAES